MPRHKPLPTYGGRLVRVVWEDVASTAPWKEEREVDEWLKKPSYVIEVGYVVRKTTKYLVLASERGIEDDTPTDWGNLTKIPRALIRSIRRL